MNEDGWGTIPNWLVRDPKVSAQAKLIYVYLNSRVGRTGSCWPALDTVATETGISRSTVQRALKELRALGVVEWWTEATARGRVNRYRLSAYQGGFGQGDQTPPGGCGQGDPTHVVTLTNKEEPHEEEQTPLPPKGGETTPTDDEPALIPLAPVGATCDTGTMSQPVATPSRRREVPDTDPEWVRFWSTYPRRTGKGAARRAWTKAVRATDPGTIHAAVEVYAQLVAQEIEKDKREGQGRDTLQFIPHPSSWLNQERWTDDLPAPAAQRKEAYRPPKKHEECTLHQGEWADRCRPCASERLARPD